MLGSHRSALYIRHLLQAVRHHPRLEGENLGSSSRGSRSTSISHCCQTLLLLCCPRACIDFRAWHLAPWHPRYASLLSYEFEAFAMSQDQEPSSHPAKPGMHISSLYLKFSTLGMVKDDRTLESYGIGVGSWTGLQWIDVLEINI